MTIEEVYTFKINKGENVYKTTNAKITVYKIESAKQKVLSQVSYNGDKNNSEK